MWTEITRQIQFIIRDCLTLFNYYLVKLVRFVSTFVINLHLILIVSVSFGVTDG
jgi:hypothetical protein